MQSDSSGQHATDANLIKPGDIVWLDAKHLTPTRGAGGHTWPHYAICLYHYLKGGIPDLIVTGTTFQFVCISSLTKANPLNPRTQVQLDHKNPNLGLKNPSAACVDFVAEVQVTLDGKRHVLDGVKRLTSPVVWRVPAVPTLQEISVLFTEYWTKMAQGDP